MPKKKQESGGRRMAKAKKRPVLLGLTDDQFDLVKRAMELDDEKFVTQFFVRHTLAAARNILQNNSKKP